MPITKSSRVNQRNREILMARCIGILPRGGEWGTRHVNTALESAIRAPSGGDQGDPESLAEPGDMLVGPGITPAGGSYVMSMSPLVHPSHVVDD
jgi:hypothetical protein